MSREKSMKLLSGPSLAKVAVWMIVLAASRIVEADPYYCYRSVRDLKTFDEKLPGGERPPATQEFAKPAAGAIGRRPFAYAALEGRGEVYIDPLPPQDAAAEPGLGDSVTLGTLSDRAVVAVCLPQAPKDEVVTGWLYVPRDQGVWLKPVKFFLRLKSPPADSKAVFGRTKARHYERLIQLGYPGTAWFQHQVRQAQGLLTGQENLRSTPPDRIGGAVLASNDIERLFSLFGGSRAIDENLQLDRRLPATTITPKAAPIPTVSLDTLPGVSTAEIDWKPMIAGKTPVVDPLALLVPGDQHALFVPDLQAAIGLVEEASAHSAQIWRSLGVEHRFQTVFKHYERQLGVALADLEKTPETPGIQGIVLTGSDPYFVAGTDVALLFQSDKAQAVVKFLKGRIEAASKASGIDLKPLEKTIAGAGVFSVSSPDRRFSAFLTATGNTVVLSNSAVQVEAILETGAGRRPSLSSSQDYRYFRLKYPRQQVKETAFLVLSDATIRRWCGPRWRIASARRMLASAALAAIQADQLPKMVEKQFSDEPLANFPIDPKVDLGEVRLTKQGIRSSIYGTLDFQTPISELSLSSVTKSEADAYEVWRDGYQRNWRGVFDPIAVRLNREQGSPRKLGIDLTVTPLILGSDYQPIVRLAGGSSISETAGDPHPGTLVHAITAIDTKSNLFQSGAQTVSGMTNLSRETVISWVGKSAALYLDRSPAFAEILKKHSWAEIARERLSEIPVALHVEVIDGVKLAIFLTGLRTFAEQSAPGLLAWETREYKGRKYVRVSQNGGQGDGGQAGAASMSLCYAATPKAFIVSPNQATIERYFDRTAQKQTETDKGATAIEPKVPEHVPGWIGRHLGLRVTQEGLKLWTDKTSFMYQLMLRSQSWSNIPILNEWHRLAPDRDPVQLHEELWGERLVCPGGGKYVWDDRWHTMKSTVFGHPGESRPGLEIPLPFAELLRANLGISFEDGGLRGRGEFELGDKP